MLIAVRTSFVQCSTATKPGSGGCCIGLDADDVDVDVERDKDPEMLIAVGSSSFVQRSRATKRGRGGENPRVQIAILLVGMPVRCTGSVIRLDIRVVLTKKN